MPKKTPHLVEHQALFQEIQRHLAELIPPETLPPKRPGPWVSISRQAGSGGRELARQIAEPLGWRIYDREIVSSIAKKTHSSESLLRERDGKTTGAFDGYLAHLLVPDDPGQAGFLEEMGRVIVAIAQQGGAVILGRGANWLLGTEGGLRLRVVAPLESRIENLVREEGISPSQARKAIDRLDAAQRRFIRQTFGRDIDDPLGYDMVLNLGTMLPEVAACMVDSALHRKLRLAE